MPSTKKILITAISVFTLLWIVQASDSTTFVPQAYAAAPSDSVAAKKAQEYSIMATMFQTVGGIAFDIVTLVADPDFYLEMNGKVEKKLHRIWKLSRDIVNTIFAFMLVIGALATVITAKGDFFQRYAFKFVIALILVNFSWFFPRVILDVGNVLAATIYHLPTTIGTSCLRMDGNPCEFASDFRFFDLAFANSVDAAPGGVLSTGAYKCPNPNFCYKTELLSTTTNTANGILNGLIMNHAKLGELLQIQNPSGALSGISTVDPLQAIQQLITYIVKTGFTIAILVAVTLVMISMAVIFMIRIPVLWITIAFMPFMFIGFVIGDITSSFNTMAIFKKFVSAAFLPAIVAIPMSIGYLLINETILIAQAPSATGSAASNFPGGVDNIYQLIFMITSILIIWKGFFMAVNASGDEMYTGAVSGIKSFGDNLGNIALKAPLSIPVLPGAKRADGTTEYTSIGEIVGQSGLIDQASSSASRGKLDELLRGKGGSGGGGGGGPVTSNETNFINNINNTTIQNAASSTNSETEFRKILDSNLEIANSDKTVRERVLVQATEKALGAANVTAEIREAIRKASIK
ncbi:MAG: hypothetical protein O2904_02055 [bacterium]|nr:hypothetical protein [bacterium]